MKTFLLFVTCVIAISSGAVPNLPVKLAIGALLLMVAGTEAVRRAPVGYQDENGFHIVRGRRPAARGRARLRLWPSKKKLLIRWLFLDSARPAKA